MKFVCLERGGKKHVLKDELMFRIISIECYIDLSESMANGPIT